MAYDGSDGFWYIWLAMMVMLVALSIARCRRRRAQLEMIRANNLAALPMEAIPQPPGYVAAVVNGQLVYVPAYSSMQTSYPSPYSSPSMPSSDNTPVMAVPIGYSTHAQTALPYQGSPYHIDDYVDDQPLPKAVEEGTYVMSPSHEHIQTASAPSLTRGEL